MNLIFTTLRVTQDLRLAYIVEAPGCYPTRVWK